MTLNIHNTANPCIFFAGGDLFSEENLSQFDGLICFAYDRHSGGRPAELLFSLDRGTLDIPFPHIFHGINDGFGDYSNGPSIARLAGVINNDLKRLAEQGSRNIAFIGTKVKDGNYIDGAKESIRAISYWLKKNSTYGVHITLVADDDDYYNRLGWDPLETDSLIFNPNPSRFEQWFEKDFPGELRMEFMMTRNDESIPFNPDSVIVTSDDYYGKICPPRDVYRSVALFYITLLPQAAAKVAGTIDIMYAFEKIAHWPSFDRCMADTISPFALLETLKLLPRDDFHNGKEEWIRLAKEEKGYFAAIMKLLIEGRIFAPSHLPSPADNPELFISAMGAQTKGRVMDEIDTYLAGVEDYLRGNGPAPDLYYIKRDELIMDAADSYQGFDEE